MRTRVLGDGEAALTRGGDLAGLTPAPLGPGPTTTLMIVSQDDFGYMGASGGLIGHSEETPAFRRRRNWSKDAAGRWFVSLLVEEKISPLPPVTAMVGIDAGITVLATLSTGEKVVNPRHERRDRRRLAKAQRALACTHQRAVPYTPRATPNCSRTPGTRCRPAGARAGACCSVTPRTGCRPSWHRARTRRWRTWRPW